MFNDKPFILKVNIFLCLNYLYDIYLDLSLQSSKHFFAFTSHLSEHAYGLSISDLPKSYEKPKVLYPPHASMQSRLAYSQTSSHFVYSVLLKLLHEIKIIEIVIQKNSTLQIKCKLFKNRLFIIINTYLGCVKM